jgi:hypothetical protein
MDTFNLKAPLQAVGELLARGNAVVAIVVVGGTALNLQGFVSRTTQDVDVIALGRLNPDGPPGEIIPPDDIPAELRDAVVRVARDFGLSSDWLNSVVAAQWKTGLPPGFDSRILWQRAGGLWIGLAGRLDLIFLKLYAAADDGPTSRHFTDLLALKPTEDELRAAAAWIKTQDPSQPMSEIVEQVIAHVLG